MGLVAVLRVVLLQLHRGHRVRRRGGPEDRCRWRGPQDRPADAHDVAATYRLAADPNDQLRTPRSGEQLVEILPDRHRVLMATRTEMCPGEFKVEPNYAGGYQFVLPELVEGTLTRGFDLIDALAEPLGRAVAMMALVTECQPFDDGNGGVARLTSNAELSVAGQVRIVIPTVYWNNYLAALSGMSGGAGKGSGPCGGPGVGATLGGSR